jgi:hypothetical protein
VNRPFEIVDRQLDLVARLHAVLGELRYGDDSADVAGTLLDGLLEDLEAELDREAAR